MDVGHTDPLLHDTSRSRASEIARRSLSGEASPLPEAPHSAALTLGSNVPTDSFPLGNDLIVSEDVRRDDAMNAAEYAASSENANWRRGSSSQLKVLVGLTLMALAGNCLLWLVADFVGDRTPAFFASLLALLFFTGSAAGSISRGTLRSMGTLILNSTLHRNVCAAHYFLTIDDASSLVSTSVVGVPATTYQLRLMLIGALISIVASIFGMLAAYADPFRMTRGNAALGFGNGNGIVGIISAFFLTIGSATLWSVKQSCELVPIDFTAPVAIAMVLLFSVITNDFEARDLVFVFLAKSLYTAAPIFTELPQVFQQNINSVYYAGTSLVFAGGVIFSLGTLGVSIKRRPPRFISIHGNKALFGGLLAAVGLALGGALITWLQDANNTVQRIWTMYRAGFLLLVACMQFGSTWLTLRGLTLVNLVLVPTLVAPLYPAVFILTGLDRLVNVALILSGAAAVFTPIANQLIAVSPQNRTAQVFSERSYPYFTSGIVLVISTWLALSEAGTGAAIAPNASLTAKLQLTAVTGYIGFLIVLSYSTRSEDGLKMAFYLSGAALPSTWPWGLDSSGGESISTTVAFFALVMFIFRYLVELGDGAFIALTVPGEDALKETPLEAVVPHAYQGEPYPGAHAAAETDTSLEMSTLVPCPTQPRPCTLVSDSTTSALIGELTDTPSTIPERRQSLLANSSLASSKGRRAPRAKKN